MDSGEIDALVQQARANNNPMYWIDEELLQSPPASAEATSVSILSPALARPGAFPT